MSATLELKPRCTARDCPDPEGGPGNPVRLFECEPQSGLEVWLCRRCEERGVMRLWRAIFGRERSA